MTRWTTPALAVGLALSAGTTAYAAGGTSHRSGATPTTVTIKAQGTDLSGTVSSPHPKVCAKGRNVLLMKVVGSKGGGDDKKIGSDHAEKSGSVFRWSTGNTGIEGRFYAKVNSTASCKGATSKVVHATRNN
jgi:hypothetical protein